MRRFMLCTGLVAMVLTGITALHGSGNLGGHVVFGVVVFVALMVYLAPSIVLYGKRHRHRQIGLLINVLAGWLGVPWLLLLLWARRQPDANRT